MANILIVDDDELSSKFLSKSLEKSSFNCIYLEDGNACLEVLEKSSIDLILLDVMMPKISGLELLKKIREKYKNFEMPVIMVTSKDGSADIVNAFKLGANDYLTKPVDLGVAIARLNTHLELKALHAKALKAKEISAINSMVATYNHEINNPLAICMGLLRPNVEDMTQERIDKLDDALMRIADIVKKIESVTREGVQFDDYTSESKTKILKLK